MGNRGYRVPHTPGGLWELSSTPLSTTGSCIFPHMVGGNGGCLCGKKKSRKVVNWSERRGMAPIGHTPPSLLPQSPLLPSLYYPHNPNSQFLEEFHTSVSTRKAENGGVPCFRLIIPPTAASGVLSAVGGRRGDVASCTGHPPHSWRAGRDRGTFPSCDSDCRVFMQWPILTLCSSGTLGPKRWGKGLASTRDVPKVGGLGAHPHAPLCPLCYRRSEGKRVPGP